MEEQIKLTVITSTYNRKNKIQDLFESLCEQTNRDFQWLVIDDGSTDGTKEWFNQLSSTDFMLEYYYKKNGGKHTALNFSHEFIKGKYVVIVDSDDILAVDAVEQILFDWNRYVFRDDVAMITYKRGRGSNREDIGSNFPTKNSEISLIEAINNGISGDHCETVRADLFCSYKFPEFPSEHFVGELLMRLNISEEKK